MLMSAMLQGLNFSARWWDLHPKFKNPIEKNREGGILSPSVFWKCLILWNKTVCFRQINRFYYKAGQFLGVHGNFSLQGSVQVFYPGSYFCEIVIFVNLLLFLWISFLYLWIIFMFVKKLHAINFNYWIEIKHD